MAKVARIVFVLALLFPFTAKATHIVGGEFELIHISDNLYRVNLILYFDVVNGNPNAFDPTVSPVIFRKSDFQPVTGFSMPFFERTSVPYSIQECAIGELVTDKIEYTTTIVLSPEIYNDPQGYRIVWERCCRNATIDNILAPAETGQKFMLDFPPVTKDGEPFVNSSPVLFPPLRDYACINQFYFVEFAGQDPDDDSLVYSLAVPLNTSAFEPIPDPFRPELTFLAEWAPGISLDNVIPGNPPLKIDKDGLLTVTPSQTGLFVFSVKVEEFRDGEKIGEVRRDFQMLVLDCPPPGIPPLVQAKPPNETEFKTELGTISYSREDEKCLEFIVTDKELNENIRLKAKPVNFKGDISDILSIDQGFVNGETDTLKVDVCFQDCPYTIDGPFVIDLLAFDNTCPQGLIDTLRFAIQIEPPFNQDPFFANANKSIIETVPEQEIYSLAIEGRDADHDSLILEIINEDFNLADFGMEFSQPVYDVPNGKVNTTFTWDTGCQDYDFTQLQNFKILLLLDDLDTCLRDNQDTLELDLSILLPPNTDPVLSTDLQSLPNGHDTLLVEVKIRESLNFTLFAEDADQDFILLEGFGDGFDFSDYNIEFKNDSGFTSLSSPLSWDLVCGNINLEVKDEFLFDFVATDRDKCKFPNADSLIVKVSILPPDNQPPVLSYNNLSEGVEIINNEAVLEITDEISLDILGSDIDDDSLSLTLIEAVSESGSLPAGYEFNEIAGKGKVNSVFNWKPGCEDLAADLSPSAYVFKFLLEDHICYEAETDTLELTITLQDLETSQGVFLPPNVFTPNGDNNNDFFELSSLALPDEMRLPDDNCYNSFEQIKIFNRWGKEVFSSKKRDFKWDGKDMQAGVYYYHLVFSRFEYKGTVSILK